MFTKKISLLVFVTCLFFSSFLQSNIASAESVIQQAPQVNYDNQEPMDSDLDGLTDQAEIQIYKTDPKNEDVDGDGYFDGAEILANSDPLDKNSTPLTIKNQTEVDTENSSENETPWAWYVSRASGLVGFALLYISIFLGLVIRLPFLHKYFKPLLAMNGHCWISLQAAVLALVHGIALTFDKYLSFRLTDIFLPFSSSYKPALVALGTISFYLMIILVVTSYGRKYLSQKIWRTIHFFNIALYVFTIIHAYNLGTDMKNDIIANVFIFANVILIWLMLTNMYLQIKANMERKKLG